MKKIIRVEITQEDIDKGTPRQALHCPLARALSRIYDWVSVGAEAHVYPKGTRYQDRSTITTMITLSLRQSARRFIKAYDSERKVTPRTVLLETLP